MFRNVLRQRNDASFRLEGPSRAIEASETLTQRVEGGCLGDQAIEIEVHSDFKTLRGNNERHLRFGPSLRAGEERLEPLCDPIAVHTAGAANHQDRVALGLLPEDGKDAPRERHAIDHDTDGQRIRPTFSEAFHHGDRLLRESPFGRHSGQAHQSGRFGRAEAAAEFGVGAIRRRQPKRPPGRGSGGGGQQNALDSCPPYSPDGAQRLPKRLREMRLVQQDQRPFAEQSRVDRLHPVGHPVAPEQQPGPHLVHGRTEDGGLAGSAGPNGFQRRPATKAGGHERRLPVTREILESVTDRLQDGMGPPSGRVQGPFDPDGAVIRGIDYQTAIHDQGDPDRSAGRIVGSQRQMEHCDVERSRLPATRGEVEDIGPLVGFAEIGEQLLLPRKRPMTVDRLKERSEVMGTEFHGASPASHDRVQGP